MRTITEESRTFEDDQLRRTTDVTKNNGRDAGEKCLLAQGRLSFRAYPVDGC